MLVATEPKQKQQSARFLAVPFIEWGLVVALVFVFVWHAFIPAWRNLNSDFPNYYLAGLLLRHGISLERIYEWPWFQRQNDRLGVRQGLVGFAPNPPVCALPIAPLTSLSPLAAKRVWLILNLGFLAAALSIIKRVTLRRWQLLLLISFSCLVPLHSNFLLGQYYVLLLLLICAGYYCSVVGKPFLSGTFLGAATVLKLFPAPFLLFFLLKRNWSAVKGFLCACLVLIAASVATLGWNVHSVFFSEILPQVSRGDWLAPYDLWRNSFTTLWSHLFLFEPQLNPSPVVNSATLYVIATAATTTALFIGFMLVSSSKGKRSESALEWSALVALCLLLSTTTGSYHPTVLIFAAVVGVDALLRQGTASLASALFASYFIASIPIPHSISAHLPLRLFATVTLYSLLLYQISRESGVRIVRTTHFVAAGASLLILLAIYGRSIRYRSEDFSRHISVGLGVRASNPVSVAGQIAITDMQPTKYTAIVARGRDAGQFPGENDVLSLAGGDESRFLYLELAGTTSNMVRLPVNPSINNGEPLFEGHDPALSKDGKWLAFLRDDCDLPELWLTETSLQLPARLLLSAAYDPLDVTVSSEGDVIVAVGPASSPYFVIVEHDNALPQPMRISGATRYPALSPDGNRLAFSRRERGSWHLFVRDLAGGAEQQLTYAACNATYPSWENAHTLLYATDCGRGVGLTAIARVAAP